MELKERNLKKLNQTLIFSVLSFILTFVMIFTFIVSFLSNTNIYILILQDFNFTIIHTTFFVLTLMWTFGIMIDKWNVNPDEFKELIKKAMENGDKAKINRKYIMLIIWSIIFVLDIIVVLRYQLVLKVKLMLDLSTIFTFYFSALGTILGANSIQDSVINHKEKEPK